MINAALEMRRLANQLSASPEHARIVVDLHNIARELENGARHLRDAAAEIQTLYASPIAERPKIIGLLCAQANLMCNTIAGYEEAKEVA